MPLGFRLLRRDATVALSFACLALVTACGSSSASSRSGTPSATASASPTISALVVGAEQPPSSCGEIPVSLISPYIGDVATTTSLGTWAPVFEISNGVRCEFANAGSKGPSTTPGKLINTSKGVVINIGQGNASSFTTLRTSIAGAPVTTIITPISGLGTSAFSSSVHGRPSGVYAVTAQYVVFMVVTVCCSIDQDEALIRQLMQLF